ncbi:Txe/YoeB family addiction module toxin [Arcanobacterium haemolyticum]|uniref:Endoribonuclease YoeB n=1 Tax=Arcanobacterium haemolyticum (strain ATCC 9345 / DSM 20595 / CCM 5947 / CCUG 17215 / LMG 16163 / NBRC 15585 / NCTC 8452 / 11018) TaxID=644284 RepID=D7BMR6_ARCHD|nr:Txe/YoeB family addiction module toxin [Arcanobacterium haemolyticum]ADH92215.1 addiction module toxin, Txe/YoeB family [Arcanobacterium haemolyticum DSM 20595]
MVNKIWAPEAWDDYVWWQTQDRKTLKRINSLIKDIERGSMYEGIGKPEPLRGELSGFWSRRIDDKNRLVYRVRDGHIEIASCRSHYGAR